MLRLVSVVSVLAAASGLLMKQPAPGSMFSIKAKEAANQGKGLPGCDKDTFIRYRGSRQRFQSTILPLDQSRYVG